MITVSCKPRLNIEVAANQGSYCQLKYKGMLLPRSIMHYHYITLCPVIIIIVSVGFVPINAPSQDKQKISS